MRCDRRVRLSGDGRLAGRVPLAYGGVARAERLRLAEEALLAVGLPPACFDVRAEELAQSQRCRVAIARAAASKPSVVLADEPTSRRCDV